jgi:hypothetical protein
MGVFADTRFCADLARLLERVERGVRRGRPLSVKPVAE